MNLELFSERSNDPGLLVTIDGPNGSGKTSLTAAMAAELRVGKTAVHCTRQPSPTPLGDLVRNAESNMRGRALACLVAADRQHQAATEIAAHLSAGEIVLCDRYVESSLVLQRFDEVETEYILAINAGIPRPDLRIRLLADPEVLGTRLAARPRGGRRFEETAGPQRELALYAEADELLASRYGLAATTYDTSHSNAAELGATAARIVQTRLGVDEKPDSPRHIDA